MARQLWKTIVVGVDGSKYAESALDASIALAKCQGAKLIIANVYPNPTVLGFLPPYAPQVPAEYESSVKTLLKKYEERAKSAGVEAESKVIGAWSNAGGALIAEAGKYEDSVIVVGTRGFTGLKSTVLGSVAEYITKNSDRDVITIKC